jgi:BirA family biotin operon repressor/biotin-[acetyl-CoA-carboxylase] ligase
MDRVNRLVGLLYDRKGQAVSLREASSAAGVSHGGLEKLWVLIAQRGHQLEFTPAGVRLAVPTVLDAYLIERDLGVRRVGRNVICFSEAESTNDLAADCAAQAGADGLAVLAEWQRRGRGRLGRRWISPPRANVLMSVLLIDPREALPHEALTIAAGLAVAEGIDRTVSLPCRLKWPNDVLLEGRKTAGVLVELRRRRNKRCVVVGVGINVNAAPPEGQVDSPATCLREHAGEPLERTEIVRGVLRRLDYWVGRLEAGELEGLHSAWRPRCEMINQRVVIASAATGRLAGRVLDVDPLEGLILCDDQGRRHHLPACGSTVVG